jgi:hypothetical protein
MDRFRRIIEGGYQGFQTGDARQIIRDSAEVTHYIESKRGHLAYVQQLMNDKIIDEAMGRVRDNGDFEYDGDGAFTYRPGVYHNTQYPRQLLAEEYPKQQVYPQHIAQSYNYSPQTQQYTSNDNVMARLEAMEREMANLRAENQELKTRYGNLK